MLTINATVNGHLLKAQAQTMASGSVGTDVVRFTFDGEWAGLTKMALFWRRGEDVPYAVTVDSHDEALIPWEVLDERRSIKFGVYGVEAGQTTPRITSTLLTVQVPEGAWSSSIANPGTPTPSLIDQVIAELTAAAEAAAIANKNFAGQFYNNTDYRAGQYVIYATDGKLYRFTVDHPAGAWIGTDVIPVWIGTVLTRLDEAVGKTLQEDGTNTIDDCNDAVANRIYTLSANTSNLPVARPGTLLTIDGDSSTGAGQAQMYFLSDGTMYIRTYWGYGQDTYEWSPWYNPGAAASEYSVCQGGTNTIDDCNDAEANRIYTLSANTSNLPVARAGTLLTVDGDASTAAGQTQIYALPDGTMYTRTYWGYGQDTYEWSPWCCLSNNREAFSGVEMFERIGVIGDSFASGCLYKNSTYTDHYNLSWPQILARMSGVVGVNYSMGGMNTHDFMTNSSIGMPKVLSDISGGNPCGLYLLCLGLNDSNASRNPGGLTYLGTESDIHDNDYTQNADSFWGNYGRIIQQIKTASSSSRIVMCNFKRNPSLIPSSSDGYEPFREAIAGIAEHFNLPFISLDDDEFFNSSYYLNQMAGAHPTAPQYVGYAKAMNRLISKAIVDNYAYFMGYDGTGIHG